MPSANAPYVTRERLTLLPIDPTQVWVYWRVTNANFVRGTLRILDHSGEARLSRPAIEAEGEHFLSLDPYSPTLRATLHVSLADGSSYTLESDVLYMPPIESSPVLAPEVRTGNGFRRPASSEAFTPYTISGGVS